MKTKLTFRKSIIWILFVSSFMMTSCMTYHITTQSLLQQLANTQPEKKINILVAFPIVFPGIVNGNSLTEVKVLDNHEHETIIPVSRQTGVRITKKDGTRKTFYFDTLLVQDSTITGKNDHFFGVNITPINLNNIDKIELQK
jgi:hypothetical protein